MNISTPVRPTANNVATISNGLSDKAYSNGLSSLARLVLNTHKT